MVGSESSPSRTTCPMPFPGHQGSRGIRLSSSCRRAGFGWMLSVQDEGMPRTLISDFSNLTWETCWWSGCLDQQRPVPTGMMLEHGLGLHGFSLSCES